jgi:hypothetical protein
MMRSLLTTLAIVLSMLTARATHMSGGEIYWDCLGNNQYRITMVIYRDCAGINVDPSYTLQVTSPCGNTTLVVSTPGGQEISQLCNQQLPNSTCNGGSLPGIQQYIYTGTITLPPCNFWTISYTNIYRNNAIVNLQNPGAQRTYIRATINNSAVPCNDSPQFTNTAIPFVCLGFPITYSFGAFDPESDSLSYQLISAMGINGAPLAYVSPNTGALPIPGLTLNPATGQVNFTLSTQGNWVVVVQVNHWVNGQIVGTVMRDMQFVAYPCTNDPPDPTTGVIQNVTGTAVQTGPRAIRVCESGSFCFSMPISDPNLPNVLTAFSNIQQNLPGATFSYTGSNPIMATVCWTAQPGSSGFYPFIVNVNDGACPIPAFQTYVYTVTVIPGLYGTVATTNESCAGTANGTATANITAGTAPFQYQWSNGATTPTMTAGAGNYTVIMTDANGCVSPPISATIATTGQPNVANAGPDQVGCAGSFPVALSGSVVNATGGAWSGGAGTFSGSWPNVGYTPTTTEIAAGTVTLTLTTTGNTGCPPASDQVVLNLQNSFANATVTPTDALCFGTATGSAVFVPAQPGFTYAWSTTPVQSTPTATALMPGNYSVTATDAFGCSITLTTTIGPAGPLTVASITATDESCAGFGNGNATVSATGGTVPYIYTWSNGANTPTMTAGAGTYSVSITDANGCAPATGSITINAAAQPNLANAGPDLIGCVGSFPIALNGSVTNATGGAWSGGNGSFSGTWPNVNYAPSVADIAAGNVTLTLATTGNTNCPQAMDQLVLTIPNSFANATVTPTDALCNGTATGFAAFTPALPGFTYGWNTTPVQTTATATGLAAGNYTVTATDGAGCTTTLTTTVGQPSAIALASLTATDETCAGFGNGSVAASASGGTMPYAYTWSNGGSASTITAGAGTYSVSITDANGCAPATGSITINAVAQPNLANAGADLIGCVGSFPIALNGSVTNATSGSWSGGSGNFSGTWPNVNYSPSPADIAAGSVGLTLTTTGNTNCPQAADQLVLNIPNSFANATVTPSDALCNGTATGFVAFTPALPGFTYGWNTTPVQTTATATGLAAGNYTVTATDGAGCTTTLTTTVGQPSAIALASLTATDETCAGFGNGSVAASASGGTMPYAYTWSNGGSASTITAGAGTYSVSITDANGCAPATGSITINAVAQPNLANAGADLIGCVGSFPIALNGSVTNATSGSWSGGSGNFSGTWPNVNYSPSPADIAAGSVGLTLTTTGNTNCPQAADQLVLTIPNSYANATVTPTDAICSGTATGSAVFAPALPGATYAWSTTPVQTGPTASDLMPGSYNVTATDSYGCSITMSTTIGPVAPVSIASLTATDETCAGFGNGTATVSATGGTMPYTYAWSNGGNTASITAGAGSYTVSITDANGCAPATGSITINATGQPNAANAGPDLVGCLNSYPIAINGSIVNATGATWTGGQGAVVGSGAAIEYMPTTAEVLAGGVTLTLTTTGNSTCPPASDQVFVALSNSFMNAALSTTNLTCNSSGNGNIVFAPALSGNTYVWNDPMAQITPNATGLAAGTYTVQVTDALGCDTSLSATISQPAELTIAALNSTNVSCNNGNNGTAQVMVSGGTPNYTFTWSSGQSTAVIGNLTAGTYSVNVTDANGCTTAGTTTITQPAPILLSAFAPDTVCVNAPVTLTAQANGGTGNFIYAWAGLGSGSTLTAAFSQSQNVVVNAIDQNGCTSAPVTLPVYVLNLSTASFTAYGDTTVCPGGVANVGAMVGNYPGSFTMVWTELGTLGSGPFTVPITGDQDLNVVVTDQCGNVRTEVVELRLQTPPAIVLPPIMAQGCAPLGVQFPDLELGTGLTYSWNLGNGSSSSQASPFVTYFAGSYAVTLTVTTSLGCTSTSASAGQVVAYQPPTAAFTASPWTAPVDNGSIVFTSQTTGSITGYEWTFGDGGTGTAPNPTHVYGDVGTFEVELIVTDVNGCTATAVNPVVITPVYDITLPTAFTPNANGGQGGGYDPNDLSNDVFYAFVRSVKEFRMRIFNRWGELVFESDDVMKGWDGYYRNQLSPQDVYVVQTWVRFVDDKEVQKLTDLTLFR